MTTFPARITGTDAGRPPQLPGRPVSQLIVFAVYGLWITVQHSAT